MVLVPAEFEHLNRGVPMEEARQVTVHSLKAPVDIEAELKQIGVVVAGLFTPSGDGWEVILDADSASIGTLRILGYQVTES
jgi:hypothetical protein